MEIYFIRHGEASYNSSDDLTLRGKEQVEMAALFIKEQDISKILTSPLNRCVQTAEILSLVLDIPFSIEKDLRERESSPQKEEYESFMDRVTRLIFHGEHDKAILVSHGDVFAMLKKYIGQEDYIPENATFYKIKIQDEIEIVKV